MVKHFKKVIDFKTVSSLVLYTVELPSRHLAVIEEVYTEPEHRGKGYATDLVMDAIAFAKDNGCDCVELTVRQDRPQIQEFYKLFGFTDRQNVAMRLPFKSFKSWGK